MALASTDSLKQALDDLVDQAELDWEPRPEEKAVIDEAIHTFKAAGPAVLDDATEHLWAYYDSVISEARATGWTPPRLPEAVERSEIWGYVSVRFPPAIALGGTVLAPSRVYISFEGEVPWEPEHGLQLVVEEGRRIGKLGPYDGHLTIAHAFDDPSLLGVVFR